jgi:hypothetical protein
MKLKSFCTEKKKVTKLKRKATEKEKILGSYKSVRGLITRIYMELKKLNSQRINDPLKKWANKLNRIFPTKKYKWPKTRRNAQHPWP